MYLVSAGSQDTYMEILMYQGYSPPPNRRPIDEIAPKKQNKNHQPKYRALSSSSTKQSAQQRVREQTQTRQNNPYRLGAAPAGVVGARSRWCPAATVPAAVVFACGVHCCHIYRIDEHSIHLCPEWCITRIHIFRAKRVSNSHLRYTAI